MGTLGRTTRNGKRPARRRGEQAKQPHPARVAAALEKRPDLILMDIQLPKISGLEATRRLRAEPATAKTPIIAIISFALSGDEQKASEAGATAYLAKPYSPRDLLGLIRRILPEG